MRIYYGQASKQVNGWTLHLCYSVEGNRFIAKTRLKVELLVSMINILNSLDLSTCRDQISSLKLYLISSGHLQSSMAFGPVSVLVMVVAQSIVMPAVVCTNCTTCSDSTCLSSVLHLYIRS